VRLLALCLAGLAFAAGARAAGNPAQGRALYVLGCASCHGLTADGVRGRGPSLDGVGAAAVDFYLSTGRMPLDDPGDPPDRTEPSYTRAQIDDLLAYLGAEGPAIPRVDSAKGDLAEGRALFVENCAGCHQVVARGGVVPPGLAPAIQEATAVQIAEAVRVGPWVMPAFDQSQLSGRQLDSVVRYVLETRDPASAGGWGLFHIGQVPEGMVAWLIGGAALLLVIRLLGQRTER
jgi:ubiquinol-cytochrome c reductase cytochrome c subunit